MTKKFKILIGLNLAIIGLIAITSWLDKPQRTSNQNRISFGLGNWQSLSAIRVDNINLKLQNGLWTLENGQAANTERLVKLLSTVDRVEVLNELSKSEINVEAFNSKQVEFYVGGVPVKTLTFLENQDQILISEDAQNWYSIYLPGSELSLSDVMGNGIEDWMNNQIFQITWRTLNYFQIIYPGDKDNSVNIHFDNEFYKVDNISELDSGMLYNYISQLTNVKIDQRIERQSLKDSLNNYEPFCLVRYEDMNGVKNDLEVYPGTDFIYLKSSSDSEIIGVLPQDFQNVLISRKLFDKNRSQ
ncbi:hypothetical protein [Sediminitomix flava]|uniref:DUF4340 domain-containing protein n=1 Tax=Sediminitomix flava TaxID=379075 RepID=A0A315ZBL9_SEDFL|nr:hypothetical protein [Sediminitomix flava]PWJ42976.1 hypothetical protein BC781_102523 [Sediminitomix flava]